MPKENKKQNVLGGAVILVAATALVKIIGAIYKIPLTGIIGSLGRGYFASAYNIYTPIYAISMAGLPVAVSTIVARYAALGKYRDVKQVLRTTFPLFFGLGIVGTGVLLLMAKTYAASVNSPLSVYSVLCIAPSILLCCIMSTYRGYYEGLNNMYPTAVSQVIESLGKLVFGLSFAYAVIKLVKVEDQALLYAYAAAAAISGVTLGTFFGAVYTNLRHRFKKDGISREMLINSPRAANKKSTVKELISIAIPAAVSSLVLNVTNFIDTWLIQNRLAGVVEKHYDTIMSIYGSSIDAAGEVTRNNIHTFLYGAYDTTLDFKNLIPTIMMTLGVSAIPIMSAAMARRDFKLVNNTVNTVFRTTMLISLPAGAGFFALSKPILSLLYNGTENEAGIAVAAPILAMCGIIMPLLTLSSPLTNMLQAIGRADVPAKAIGIGCVFTIALDYILIGIPEINIKGAVCGSALFYIICISVNYSVLKKETGIKLDIKTVILKPLVCALLCGASAWGSYKLLSSVLTFGDPSGRLNGASLSCLISIAVAVIIYAVAVLLTKTIVKDDVLMLPKGEKIAEILEKYKLLG